MRTHTSVRRSNATGPRSSCRPTTLTISTSRFVSTQQTCVMVVYHFAKCKGEPTELTNQVVPLRNSASCRQPPASHYTIFILYSFIISSIVDMPYINNSWSLKEFKVEINSVHAHKELKYVTSPSCLSVTCRFHITEI